MKTILVFAYYSFNDPVFQSAVLPYLKPITNGQQKFKYILITWEHNKYYLTNEEIVYLKKQLEEINITWHRLRWHSGKMKLLKKFYDFIVAFFYCSWLTLNSKASIVYSEGFPGAILGHYISILTRVPHVVHTFEPHAEYMLESNIWSKDSWEYLLLSSMEIRVAKKAHSIITATKKYADILKAKGVNCKIYELGSCIDLEIFQSNDAERKRIRDYYGIKNNQVVVTYLGKVGGMYMSNEIFDFFNALSLIDHKRFFFFLLSETDVDFVEGLIKESGLDRNKIVFTRILPKEVAAYLSASDLGLVGIIALPSKRYCSPIKTGEYMACELPVISPEGISDDSDAIKEYNLGVVFSKEASSESIAKEVVTFLEAPSYEEKKKAVRNYAYAKRDIQLGKKLLIDIFNQI